MALTRRLGAFTSDVQDDMAIYTLAVAWTDPTFGEVHSDTAQYQVNKANPDRLALAVSHLRDIIAEQEIAAEAKLAVLADSTTIADQVAAALEGA